MKTQTLRPGLLVSLKTSTRGNVSYLKRDLSKKKDGKAEKTAWTTERTIANRREFEAAKKTVSAATLPIRQVCNWSNFGWLCPEANRADLDAAIEESQRITSKFNAKAEITHVSVYALVATVAADDVTAVKAISSEVRELMDAMETGIKNMDVKTVRQAANKAREIGAMLSDDAADRVKIAIETARKVARQISKAGDDATFEIDNAAIRRIRQQRTAFLDMDDTTETVAAPKSKSRAVDMDLAG